MTRPLMQIHNTQSGEVIEKEMNDEQFAQWKIDVLEAQQIKTEAQAKAAARQAILDRLGLSEEEARLLLG